jgi:hypothetical protein
MVVVREPAAAAGAQQLRIAEVRCADSAAKLEALRPFCLDRCHCQEQRSGEVTLGAEAGLGERFVGCDVCNALGEGGGRVSGDEVDRSGHRGLQPIDWKPRHGTDAGLARGQPVPIVLFA